MVDQDVHPMSREEDDAQIHDEQGAQEEQVAQGVQEDDAAAPIPEDNAEDEEEAQQPRGVRDPGRPTQEMIDGHDLTYIPYRPWCDACTRGIAKRKTNRTNHMQGILSEPVCESLDGLCIPHGESRGN